MLLDWDPVSGALGYLVHRAASPDGPFEPVDHGGGDVLVVPSAPYADTTLPPGEPAWYAVAIWTEAGSGPLSAPRRAAGRPGPSGRVTVEVAAARPAGRVRPVWRMVGSEHLSLLAAAADGGWPGGADVAAELAEALRIAHDELGCRLVRAHGAFLPEMVAVRPRRRTSPASTRPTTGCSSWGCGRWWSCRSCRRRWPPTLTPPCSPNRAVISPPADWVAWGRLCGDLAAHLVERYGIDEVAGWAFEVWNEANLEVFWTGTKAEYFRLYDEAARTAACRRRSGGPSGA